MFDHITADRPHVLVTNARANYRAVVTFQFHPSGERAAGVTVRAISTADGGRLQTTAASHRWASTVQDVRANVESGMFELGYACDAQGGRLEPITGEQWTAICDNVRTTRVAQARAREAVTAAQQALRDAESALATADGAVVQAQRIFESSI